jgi:hypothetical protein
LNFSNGISENPYFYTDFRNVDLTLVNSADKNQFEGAMNTFCQKCKKLLNIPKKGFLLTGLRNYGILSKSLVPTVEFCKPGT